MRRIGRWMLNALTALSLLLCIGVTVAWVQSYSVTDLIEHSSYVRDREHEIHFASARSWIVLGVGQVLLWPREPRHSGWTWARGDVPDRLSFAEVDASFGSQRPQVRLPFLLVGWTRRIPTGGEPIKTFTLLVRDWFLVLLTAILPTGWLLLRWMGRRSRRLGRCATCSYDLTGNVSGVCPECGTKIAEAK